MRQNYYKKRIDKYDVISFDIFDTLLTRLVDFPTDIFDLVGEKTNNKSFKELRIKAEHEARQKSVNGEVNLDDIYIFMPSELKELKQIELDTELNCAAPILEMDNMFRYAIDEGKKVFIISDMYLPGNHIRRMLKKCGLPLDNVKIYISNESGANKITGKLFECAIRDNHINRANMIHFGDSLKADVLGARKAGIKFGFVARKNRIRRMLNR